MQKHGMTKRNLRHAHATNKFAISKIRPCQVMCMSISLHTESPGTGIGTTLSEGEECTDEQDNLAESRFSLTRFT